MDKDNTSDMVIVIDTNERGKHFFARPEKGVIVVRDKLQYGDYSVRGFESQVCVERKTVDDFITSLISDWDRFGQRLKEMLNMDSPIIIVEGTKQLTLARCVPEPKKKKVKVNTIQAHKVSVRPSKPDTRNVHPNQLRGRMRKIEQARIPICFELNRKEAEAEALAFLKRFYTKMREG